MSEVKDVGNAAKNVTETHVHIASIGKKQSMILAEDFLFVLSSIRTNILLANCFYMFLLIFRA